jgi:polysaccharide biosynthesis/export protein
MLSFLLSLALVAQSPSAPPAPPSQPSTPAAVQAPAATAGGAAAVSDPRAYMIGPQDKLKIVVFEEANLSNTYPVSTDGSFDFPYIGRVIAVGKTPRQLEEEITAKLADGYVRQPHVSVEIEQFRSRSIFIAGEVKTSSRMPLMGQMTLLEALVQAGWVTGNAGTMVIVTRQPSEPSTAKGVELIRISLNDLQSGQTAANIVLREGDSIFVPKADRFYVTGLVKSPGAYAYEQGMTVQQALALAGGINDKGSSRGIKIKRKVNGKDVEVGVGLNDTIEPGDTIVVRQRLL